MLTFESHIDGYYDVADQMIDHLRRRAERCFRRREIEREGVKTCADFEQYRVRMRANFLRAIGGLPESRTPLCSTVNGCIDRGAYVIEKIIYNSLPDFPVTALLYIPKSRLEGRPGPAILFVCGHTERGKADENYQRVCIDLALAGFVVLAIDPLGQGERFQYLDKNSGLQRVAWGTTEHTYAGIPYYMAGMSIARHFVWDGIRGIDYLLTRPEVDSGRIGVTGNSGGGVQSCFLMLTEPRLAAAMPCTFVMDYESYLKTGQPQDAEQNLYGSFSDGPDHDDYITAMAPKPVHLGLAAYDFFPIEGSLAALEKARKVFALYGTDATKNLGYTIAPTTHCYSSYLRAAAVKFFREALQLPAAPLAATIGGRGDCDGTEPLPPDILNVTVTGQVSSNMPGCKTAGDLLRDRLAEIVPPGGRRIDAARLRDELAGVLGIGAAVPAGEASWLGEPRSRTIYPRIIFDAPVNGYRTEKIFFFSEPDVCVTAVLMHPRNTTTVHSTELLLFEQGTDSIPTQRARLIDILEHGRNVCVFDVRGVGAVKARPITSYADSSKHNSEFRLGVDAMKMKTSTLGLRVFDVLRAVDYLHTRPDSGAIYLTGVGIAGAWALHAAALETHIAGLTLERMVMSWRGAVTTQYYDDGCINFRGIAWGLLRAADVVELLGLVAPRTIAFLQPLSATGILMNADECENSFLKPARNAGISLGCTN